MNHQTAADHTSDLKLLRLNFRRHPNNPVLPPGPKGSYDDHACMTPSVVRVGDTYRIYYAGGDADAYRRICLATAPVERPTELTRHGVVLDVGKPGDCDAKWMVGPRVRRIGDQWIMIYTAMDTLWAKGLQSINGLAIATSPDGLNWTKYGNGPSITGDQLPEFPDNKGIGGGGSPLAVPQPDGSIQWRLYCSLAVGTPNADRRIDQHKLGIVAHSADGLNWTDHRIVLRRRDHITREDYGVNYPVVWRDGELFRCLHCCLGSRWGAYSIAEAVSRDGYDWYRGEGGDDNLVLPPTEDDSWEGKMTCYPSLILEGRTLRCYYNGNGYGATGIGYAEAELPAGAQFER